MSLFYLFVLAVVQGITEFLPISSSAHLVLLHELGGPSGEDIALDIAVHLGSILAVVIYLRDEASRAFRGLFCLHRWRASDDGRMALALIVATVPAVIAGGTIAVMGWADALRDIRVIGWTMILFGLALYVVHRIAPETHRQADWGLGTALKLGLWQAVALVPGVSRSGITMTAARAMGYERHTAARISMLMSIPVTLATGAALVTDIGEAEAGTGLLIPALVAAAFAFAAAYAALALMMAFLARVSFTPYVVYRVILGMVLLAIAYA